MNNEQADVNTRAFYFVVSQNCIPSSHRVFANSS